jgi:hypothetical protein
MRRALLRLPGRAVAVLDDLVARQDVAATAELLLRRLGEESAELAAAGRLGEILEVRFVRRRRGALAWNVVVLGADRDDPPAVLGATAREPIVRAVRAAAVSLGWHDMGLE